MRSVTREPWLGDVITLEGLDAVALDDDVFKVYKEGKNFSTCMGIRRK